jgi:putative aminopeptidase FrvX
VACNLKSIDYLNVDVIFLFTGSEEIGKRGQMLFQQWLMDLMQ